MNRLLPEIDELHPITNPLATFYDCGFVEDFSALPFQKRLKIVNDLVRQTMLAKKYPDPDTEVDSLVGDSHTATRVSIEYLKHLGLGKNFKYILYTNTETDSNIFAPTHAALLVDDDEGVTYFFDAAPEVGFRIGCVQKIEECNIAFCVLDERKQVLLTKLRKCCFGLSVSESANLSECLRLVDECKREPILNSFSADCLKLLAKFAPNKTERDGLLLEGSRLNPTKILKTKQLALWQEELEDNLRENGDKRRQLELAQNYYSEYVKLHPEEVKCLKIGNQNFVLSLLTPRFFFDNGYNVIMIKPSAYNLGVRGTIREAFLKHGNGALCEYFTDMAAPTKLTHILPVSFSHTVAEKSARAYTGTSDVILLQQPADKLGELKRTLRRSLGKNIRNREVLWRADGQKILWAPGELNYVHSTDNPSEVGLNFLNGFPEQQVMTRFMYPNPKLEELQRSK